MPFLTPAAAPVLAGPLYGTAAATATTSSLLGTLSTIGTVMSAVTPFIAMASTSALAAQQVNLANQQAALTEYEIQNIEDAAALRASRRRKAFRKAVGTQLTQFGVSGVDVTEGTPIDVMAETAKEFAYDWETQNQVYANTIKAQNQRAYGRTQATGTLLDYGMRTMQRGYWPKGSELSSAFNSLAGVWN